MIYLRTKMAYRCSLTMMKTVLLFVSVCFCVGQELHIKHAPSYVVLQSQAGSEPVASSDLHEVLGGLLGLSSTRYAGIMSKSFLKRPKANVLITVVTHNEKSLPIDSKASFPIDWDIPFVDVEQLMNNVQRKFLDKDPLMLDLVSDNEVFDVKTSSPLFQSLPTSFASVKDRLLDADSIFNKISVSRQATSLNSSLSSDGGLLAELQMMDDVVSTLKKNSGNLGSKTPDLFSFTLTGLKAVGDEHGPDSLQAKEAENIVREHINKITEDLRKIYKDHVMVEVLAVPSIDKGKVRKTRSLMETVANPEFPDLNLEIDYYPDFPVTFNIVLWMIIVLALVIFFVAYGIWNMNPNLESILYRVPQDDIKKNI